MKIAVVLLALVAMAASQRVREANYPEIVQLVDYNPDLAEDDGNDQEVVVDPAFGRPGASVDPEFGRGGAYPDDGADLIDKEPAFIDPPSDNDYPKKYDNPTWRGGK